jgi:hypothetical protein
MDAYETLGIARNCTKEEARNAFRARARSVHPDRGGDVAAFIQLRHAYEQIMSELAHAPLASARTAKPDSPRDRPQRPPDPDWDPELVVRDEPLPRSGPPQPPDPHWDPELILLDDETGGEQTRPGELAADHARYLEWLRRLAAGSVGRGTADRPRWLDMAGLGLVVIVFLGLCMWLYSAATPDVTASSAGGVRASSSR